MNFKKFIIALVAGFVVMVLLSGLWHMLIMGDFYKEHSTAGAREQYKMGFIVLGYIVLALLMAYIYPKGCSGGGVVAEGAKFGILMGLLWILPFSLVLYGVIEMSGTGLIVDVVWHIVEQGVGGIVIGLVYGTDQEESS